MSLDRFYSTLGLHPNASPIEVKRAYRSLAKRFHPDKNPSREAHEQFIKITEAYEILCGTSPAPRIDQKKHQTNKKAGHETTKVKTPEQEHLDKAFRFKLYKEHMAKVEYIKQLKRYQPLRSGLKAKLFNTIVLFSFLSLLIVTFDYYLPSRLSKHRVDFWYLEGYSSFYETNVYTVRFDNVRSASIIGNGVLHLAENDIFFMEKSRIMKEPRAIYMPSKLDFWKLEFSKSMFAFLPFVYLLLMLPIGAWFVRKNIWFFHYWFYSTIYASGPFLLYFLFDELRIIRMLQIV